MDRRRGEVDEQSDTRERATAFDACCIARTTFPNREVNAFERLPEDEHVRFERITALRIERNGLVQLREKCGNTASPKVEGDRAPFLGYRDVRAEAEVHRAGVVWAGTLILG